MNTITITAERQAEPPLIRTDRAEIVFQYTFLNWLGTNTTNWGREFYTNTTVISAFEGYMCVPWIAAKRQQSILIRCLQQAIRDPVQQVLSDILLQ